jgi:hypothetical protein
VDQKGKTMNNVNEMISELRVLAYPAKSHKGITGRKPHPELRSPNKRYCVWLNPALAERVRQIGKGSRSKGIEVIHAWYCGETKDD